MDLTKFKEIKEGNSVEVLNAEEMERKFKLSEDNVNTIVNGGVKILEGIVDIIKNRTSADSEISKIQAVIEHIKAETDCQIKKIDAEYDTWEKKFEKKRDLYLHAIQMIMANNSITDSMKQSILDALRGIVND
ncbi:MAG TPA: hypothetical protein PKJ08_09140 [Candidatus Cloacimonadota bacterium]|nr:hypothetical protein [Candidatus Cloacimonadota bacterium]HPM03766.1 hypothetical protein [Candidatus Cloacimonadota bacterium]